MQCIVHEDDDLLVARKPPGWNTHSPSPFANEGLYEWLKNREPRWSRLSILHRLDKETSGLIVFGKTDAANRSLAAQFESRRVAKTYQFLTDRAHGRSSFTARSPIARLGDKYISSASGQPAETRFRFQREVGPNFLWEAQPITGRTHQIRVHAAENHIPILGDILYGGSSAARVCLHAAELALLHPSSGRQLAFRDEPDFSQASHAALRDAIADPAQTNAFRLVHGPADGWPGLFVDRFENFLLTSGENPLTPAQKQFVLTLPSRGVCHKTLQRQPVKESPELLAGHAPPVGGFVVRENGLNFKISFGEGYSAGLFLDQRDNRRRLLSGYVAPGFSLPASFEVLNTFAYTCSFSVAAARGGAKTANVDLSRKYLDWGRENFRLNQLDPGAHEFLAGDVFDWMTRLRKKNRLFDIVILDPPTFSRSKESGVFQAGKDYGRLAAAALPLIKPGGVLFASTNAANYPSEAFLAVLNKAVVTAGRQVRRQQYIPQPPDFPVHRLEPAYLKTVWLELS